MCNEGIELVFIDVTNYPALIEEIDKKFGKEWWDKLINDPAFEVMKGHDDDSSRNVKLITWEILLVAGSSCVDLSYESLVHLSKRVEDMRKIKDEYERLTGRTDTGTRWQRIVTAIHSTLELSNV